MVLLFTGMKIRGQEDTGKNSSPVNSKLVKGMTFRSIGPALMSGRITDIAVNPLQLQEVSGKQRITEQAGSRFSTSNLPIQLDA